MVCVLCLFVLCLSVLWRYKCLCVCLWFVVPCCVVCVLFDVMIAWLFVRVCVSGLNACLCVVECVMLYGLLLCVRDLCVVNSACVCLVCVIA